MTKTLLIKDADFIYTMDDNKKCHTQSSILIEGNIIKKIGSYIEEKADRTINANGCLVLPGFINTHHHLYQTLTRCIPKVLHAELFEWLINLYEIWRELTPEGVYISSQVGLGELLLTGCTTSTDMFYLFPKSAPVDFFDYLVKGAEKVGIRFHPTRGAMSCGKSKGGLPPDDVVQTEEEILADYKRVIEKHHNPDPLAMCQIALAPCSPFSVTEKLMIETLEVGRKNNIRLHTHLAETIDEEKYCIEKTSLRPFRYLEKLGWVGEDVWYAHAIHLSDDEIDVMAQTKTGMAHCPVSNMRLGSGVAKVPQMLKKGVPVSLAVDGSASNDSSDMLGELRTAMLLHRLHHGVSSLLNEDIFKIATIGGAEVLGRKKLGKLIEGMAADLIIINLNKIGFAGALRDPLSAIIMCGDTHIVDTTIVNGEVVVENGQLVNVDEKALFEEAEKISKEMIKKASKKTGINFLG